MTLITCLEFKHFLTTVQDVGHFLTWMSSGYPVYVIKQYLMVSSLNNKGFGSTLSFKKKKEALLLPTVLLRSSLCVKYINNRKELLVPHN